MVQSPPPPAATAAPHSFSAVNSPLNNAESTPTGPSTQPSEPHFGATHSDAPDNHHPSGPLIPLVDSVSPCPVNGVASSSTIVENDQSQFQPTSISSAPEPNFSKSPATNASSLFCSRTRGHSSCSNSSDTGLVKERQLEKLCITSPPIDPNHQLDDPNKKVGTDVGRGLSRDGDVDMIPVAAAASTVSSSTDPISTNPQPTTAVQAVQGSTSSTASPPAPTPNQDADHAMQESKESDSRPSPASAAPSLRPSKHDQLLQQMDALWKTSRIAAKVASSTSSSSSAAAALLPPARPLDTTCHCLVVSESRLAKDSSDYQHYTTALQLMKDPPALLQHIITWLHGTSQKDINMAYVLHDSRVHINFDSFEALGRALSTFPFLTRCGTANTSDGNIWKGHLTPCGLVKRHELPEVIKLTAIPTVERPRDQIITDVTTLLTKMEPRTHRFLVPITVSTSEWSRWKEAS